MKAAAAMTAMLTAASTHSEAASDADFDRFFGRSEHFVHHSFAAEPADRLNREADDGFG